MIIVRSTDLTMHFNLKEEKKKWNGIFSVLKKKTEKKTAQTLRSCTMQVILKSYGSL